VTGGEILHPMIDPDGQAISRATAQYPRPDITPAEFEAFVTELLGAAMSQVGGLSVTLHEKISGVDGTYDFDATVRFELGGLAFLVLVEAKRHTNPIKRELVQVLHQKVQSVGAHKGAMISTAPYQSGALEFAKTHGIALVTVTEGRFTFETRAIGQAPVMSRQEALDRYGTPVFVGHAYSPGSEPGATAVTLVSTEYPEDIAASILGVPPRG
jgi:hypothetical protein